MIVWLSHVCCACALTCLLCLRFIILNLSLQGKAPRSCPAPSPCFSCSAKRTRGWSALCRGIIAEVLSQQRYYCRGIITEPSLQRSYFLERVCFATALTCCDLRLQTTHLGQFVLAPLAGRGLLRTLLQENSVFGTRLC